MANETSINATLKYAKAKASASLATSFTATQAGDKYQAGIQLIGTSEETLIKNDVGTIGYIAVRNMDTTNFVELGAVTGQYSIKLKPSEGTVLPWGYTNVYAKANTAGIELEYLLIEA